MARIAGHPSDLRRTTRSAGSLVQALLLAGLCVYLGQLASASSPGVALIGFLLVTVTVVALAAPPHALVAATLLVLGTFSLSAEHPFEFAGAEVYSTDALLAIVLLRAILPRRRSSPPAALGVLARLLFAIWASVMVVAGLRGAASSYDAISLVRLEAPLIYGVGFYLGVGRIVREQTFDLDRAVRHLLVVMLGFVAYMTFARLTNRPFETDETVGQLGTVVTTGGELRRDYGLESAFIFFPTLALAGAAYLFHGLRRTGIAAVIATIGTVATLVSLIRSEIFGLGFGLAVIFLLRAHASLTRATRTRAILAACFTLVLAAFALWVASPRTTRGIVERSLPGIVQQSRTAEATAEYRLEALDVGLASARREPAGFGLVPAESLTAASGVEPGYLAHSGVTTILVYAGWVGLVAAVLALAGLLRASFVLPKPVPWLHAFFVGSLVMLAVYTITADGLVGQPWVIGLAPLIAALRFNVSRSESESGGLVQRPS